MDKQEKRQIAKLAITFILGVVVGFALILLGIVFFMIGLLALGPTTYATSSEFWFLLFIIFEFVGSLMIYYSLKGSPEPGSITPSGKSIQRPKYFD